MLTKDIKLWVYPAVAGMVGVVLVAWFLSRFQLSVEFEPQADPSDASVEDVGSDRPLPPIAEDLTLPFPATEDDPYLIPPSQIPAGVEVRKSIRVSNRTLSPVRVAILSRPTPPSPNSTPNPAPRPEGTTAHWDFAPGEGSTKGLTLSLPDRPLQLQPGDILVAFAQDGSRQYWGPFVVGETALPAWHRQDQEWYLVLTQE